MQTATTRATSPKVGTIRYKGPLGRMLRRQQEEREAQAAAAVATMRANVLGMLDEPHIFSQTEREAAAVNVALCGDVARLQRWFCNVHRLYTQRQHALQMANLDGTYIHIPTTA